MVAIGIDVSKGRSTVAAVGGSKKVLKKPFDIFHNKTDLAKLTKFVKEFDSAHVVMEHTVNAAAKCPRTVRRQCPLVTENYVQ